MTPEERAEKIYADCFDEVERIADRVLLGLFGWTKHVIQRRGGRKVVYEGLDEVLEVAWNKVDGRATVLRQ